MRIKWKSLGRSDGKLVLERTVQKEVFKYAPSDKIFLNESWNYVNLPECTDRCFIMKGTIYVKSGRCYRIDFFPLPTGNPPEIRGNMEIELDCAYKIPDGINRLYFHYLQYPARLLIRMSEPSRDI